MKNPTQIAWKNFIKLPLTDLARDARLGQGGFATMGPVQLRHDETERGFARRIERGAALAPMAAKTVAARLVGRDGRGETEAMIRTAKTLGKRDASRMESGPASLRGDIAKLLTAADLQKQRPSVALTVGSLRSLRFGTNINADGLALFWTLFFYAASDLDTINAERVCSLLQWQPARLGEVITSLRSICWSLENDNSVKKANWVRNSSVMQRVTLAGSDIAFIIDATLISLSRPTAGGGLYAYCDLAVLTRLRDRHDEQFLRGLLSAATLAGCWRWHGGSYSWSLEPRSLADVTGHGSIGAASILIQSVRPMVDLLSDCGSRLTLTDVIVRKAAARGSPIDMVTLHVRVAVAAAEERPKRTRKDSEYFPITEELADWRQVVPLSGTGRKDAEAEKIARATQARLRGIAARAAKGNKVAFAEPQIASSAKAIDLFDWLVECFINDADRAEREMRSNVGERWGIDLLEGEFADLAIDLVERLEHVKYQQYLYDESSPGMSLLETDGAHPQAAIDAINDKHFGEFGFGSVALAEIGAPLDNEQVIDAKEASIIYRAVSAGLGFIV